MEIRDDLAPFNYVEVGAGYPDLVGVYPFDETYLATDTEFIISPLVAYSVGASIVEELQTLHHRGVTELSLVDFVEHLHASKPTFAVELFIRGADQARSQVLREDGDIRFDQLTQGSHYHAPTVFQLKTMLFHTGILTETGDEPTKLVPEQDIWKLRDPLN